MNFKGGRYKFQYFLILVSIMLSLILTACSNSQVSNSSSTSSSGGSSKAPIKLGLLEDRSGDVALNGIPKYHAAELAVEEINKSGGLLGRKIEIVSPDPQSDNQKYQELARKLILQDKVDVIMGGMTSASREAIRPIMEQNKMLYFYNELYEGGVASKYTFITGAVPEQQVIPLIKWMMKKFGPKIYIMAPDYNFGQITADWVTKVAKENGGKIVGKEFIPLGVSQFSSTINRIQNAKPDFLVALPVGGAQSSFWEQWAKAGIKGLPIASTNVLSNVYEHKRFKPPALANVYVAIPFMEELNTPEAKDFVKRYREKFPNEPYVGLESYEVYNGVYLWAEAVKKAGTTDKEAVIKALESGISFNSPNGKVSIDPKTHHTVMNIYLARCDEKHNITFLEEWKDVVPDWLSKEKGVDLTKKPEFKQYTPLEN